MSQDKELAVLQANVATVMSTAAGQDVIWEILIMCGLYTDNSTEGHLGIEGKRSIGLQVLQLLEDADPRIYPNLLITKQEQADDRTSRNN